MYTINPKILMTPVEAGHILLLEPEAGLYFELNETSVLIYLCIKEGLKEKEILKKLLDKYDIDLPQAQQDIEDLIKDLTANKIIMV